MGLPVGRQHRNGLSGQSTRRNPESGPCDQRRGDQQGLVALAIVLDQGLFSRRFGRFDQRTIGITVGLLETLKRVEYRLCMPRVEQLLDPVAQVSFPEAIFNTAP